MWMAEGSFKDISVPFPYSHFNTLQCSAVLGLHLDLLCLAQAYPCPSPSLSVCPLAHGSWSAHVSPWPSAHAVPSL